MLSKKLKTSLCFVLILIANTFFAQLKKQIEICIISKKTLESMQYNFKSKKSPKFKVTCRTAFNKDAIDKSMMDDNLKDAFDDIDYSQLLQYNLRFRWKNKKGSKFFVGVQAMSTFALVNNEDQNSYYIGFKKTF